MTRYWCFACKRPFSSLTRCFLHALVPRKHWRWHWYFCPEEEA